MVWALSEINSNVETDGKVFPVAFSFALDLGFNILPEHLLFFVGVVIICVSSVSLLVTWLWFVLQITDSQLACPVVLVTVFHVDRDQNDPTIAWEYTRKAEGSVIWAICLLWPERELKDCDFLSVLQPDVEAFWELFWRKCFWTDQVDMKCVKL